MVKKLLAVFIVKICNLLLKVIKRKGDKLYVKWKGCDNFFNSWIDKKRSYKKSQYFPPDVFSKNNIKIVLNLEYLKSNNSGKE